MYDLFSSKLIIVNILHKPRSGFMQQCHVKSDHSLKLYVDVFAASKKQQTVTANSNFMLLQTDRASAFVIELVKNFLTSSLITMQNLVVVVHGSKISQKFGVTLGPHPLGTGHG